MPVYCGRAFRACGALMVDLAVDGDFVVFHWRSARWRRDCGHFLPPGSVSMQARKASATTSAGTSFASTQSSARSAQ